MTDTSVPQKPRPTVAAWSIDDLPNGRRVLLALLVVMFLLAAGTRLVKLDAPGVLVDRDYTSAMFAREFYFQHADGIEPWRREISRATLANQPTLEPPVTEWVTSVIYRILGHEDIRAGRVVTSVFWLLGGMFLFRTARRLVSTEGALVALALYLFLPYSILLSRSFQADAMMMLGFLASLDCIVRYHEQPSRRLLAVACLVSALTLVYRPLVMTALAGAFIWPVVQRKGWGVVRDRGVWVYGLLGLMPAVAYYAYATFVAKYFGWKLTSSFVPGLWLHQEYWCGWYELVVVVFGTAPLIMAAIGALLLRPGLPRSVIVGLALGYVPFGLLFTMHIHTHEYYQAQLIPLVAIAVAPLVLLIATHAARAPGRALKIIVLLVTLGLAGWPAIEQWREGLSRAHNEPAEVAAEIGTLVDHSPRVVFLAPYYGLSLQYLGEFTGAYWPRPITYWLYRGKTERELSVSERLAALPFKPDYFVITAFEEYERHHVDLATYLETRCRLKAKSPEYLVYEACNARRMPDPRAGT